jgi:hypothetical protein
MSRIERQIIVWGEDRGYPSGPRFDNRLAAGLVSPVVRHDQATRAVDHQSRTRDLTNEILRLRSEIEEMRQRYRDLVASAEIWIELYEHQLARANDLAARLARQPGR